MKAFAEKLNQNWALTEAVEFSFFCSSKNFGIHYKAAELKNYIYIYVYICPELTVYKYLLHFSKGWFKSRYVNNERAAVCADITNDVQKLQS